MTNDSEAETPRLFDVSGERVQEAVACTYCGVDVGRRCVEWGWHVLNLTPHPHAQRWWDYWNATHARSERVEVFPAKWLADAERFRAHHEAPR